MLKSINNTLDFFKTIVMIVAITTIGLSYFNYIGFNDMTKIVFPCFIIMNLLNIILQYKNKKSVDKVDTIATVLLIIGYILLTLFA